MIEKWKPEKLWDVHTPQNMLRRRGHRARGRRQGAGCDTTRSAFGFREFWIDGRDFYLNGTRIYLSAVPLDNAQVGAALASYEGAKETLLRLQSIRHQLRLHAQLRLRAGLACQLR